MVLVQKSRVLLAQFLPKPMSIKKLQNSSSGSKSGVGLLVVHLLIGPVQASIPSQHPNSRVRGVSASMDVPSGIIPSILSGASKAILTVIHPPWLVPRTKAFSTPNAVMTSRFM